MMYHTCIWFEDGKVRWDCCEAGSREQARALTKARYGDAKGVGVLTPDEYAGSRLDSIRRSV